MTRNAKYIAAVTAAFLAVGVYWSWSRLGRNVQPQKLAVLFTGMTNNVTRTMGPPRIEVCGASSGACALFLVTNLTSGQYLWFKTAWVERKAETGWERFTPTNQAWSVRPGNSGARKSRRQ